MGDALHRNCGKNELVGKRGGGWIIKAKRWKKLDSASNL